LKRLVYEYEKSMTERLPACSAEVGHLVSTYCTILDLKDISIHSFYRVKNYVTSAASIGQDHCPGTMGKFYIINVLFLFTGVLWAVVKPCSDEATVVKLQVVGTKNKDALLAQIPETNQPQSLGRSCQCPEGYHSLSDAPWN
ncbi:CRAL-TRIO domain-containing protein, partial [Lentinula raphanica]